MTCAIEHGVADLQGICQTGSFSCWAAATASALKTLAQYPHLYEVPFATNFLATNPPNDCLGAATPGKPWDREVLSKCLGSVLEFAGIHSTVDCGLGRRGLQRRSLLCLLEKGCVILCAPAGASSAHVLCIWHVCEKADGKIDVTVHDPLNCMGGVERSFEASFIAHYKGVLAFAAGKEG